MLSVVGKREEPAIAQRAHRRQAEREASLRACLDPSETVAGHHGGVMVTDRRMLFAWRGWPDGWHTDAISFGEITRWAVGRRHDGRPLLRIEHPTHVRVERVAAHHFLRFAWGNAEAEVIHNDVTLAFKSERDPTFRALLERVQTTKAPRGGDFVVALQGTRADRKGGSHAYLRPR